MFPIYEFQLNGYRLIAENIGITSINKMALVYTEPQTDQFSENSILKKDGFQMNFRSVAKNVDINPDIVKSKMTLARKIMNQAQMPNPRSYFVNGNKWCKRCIDSIDFEFLQITDEILSDFNNSLFERNIFSRI